jgi:hypothetical protein
MWRDLKVNISSFCSAFTNNLVMEPAPRPLIAFKVDAVGGSAAHASFNSNKAHGWGGLNDEEYSQCCSPTS